MSTDLVTEYLQQLVAFIGANPSLAGFICFFVAMGEALFLVGLFFPSTVVLVGAGTLIGLGNLEFWPIFIWTTAGAIAGDAISYWVGYLFKDQLRRNWPLNRYPQLVQRGEDFFAKHGGKSIFIGRFVPGVKSVVPGIAGMADMNFMRFTFFNVMSAFAWAAVHLVPGVLAGSALFALGEIDTRLAIILGALCLAVFLAVVMIRWVILIILPIFGGTHGLMVRWFSRRQDSVSQWIARTYDPDNPQSVGMLLSALLLLITLPVFFWFTQAIAPERTMARADLAIGTFLEAARNPTRDQIMIGLTMMGDSVVTVIVAVAVGLYLFSRKAWRRATGFVIALASSALFVVIIKSLVGRERPIDLYTGASAFSFPSSHTTVTTVLIGVLAVLLVHEKSGRFKAAVYSSVAVYAILMGFSRIYLGAHWLSDVLAGLLFGACIVAAFAFIFGHIHNEKVGRGALAGISLAALLSVSTFHIYYGFDNAVRMYQPRSAITIMDYSQWYSYGWRNIPAKRINIVGDFEEPLPLQWSGSPEEIEAYLSARGWKPAPKWDVQSATGYLKGETPAGELPPVPHTNAGRLPILTMIYQSDDDHRYVFWLWETKFRLKGTDNLTSPLYVGAILEEQAVRPFGEFSGLQSDDDQSAAINPFSGLEGATIKRRVNGNTVILAGPKP
ncbi:bifunctional DedA family/phosphatase PAP2 family protein [Pseudovibrio sp. SPO723]|uniref:bifunctional DedA family/phosphatase PAP2 family protein n=1 Tax=Nesiotobacter zosterae TaxID=392721 RepID=UPI0029C40CDA|nr:VTT domain-containing protein [Pseudovibrio sp. SPO723]MDX5595055.1 VTT domain-containing protein [Pseudovibrio sp. SPO723]